RRMGGTRKAFLRLGGETFIERILRLLGPHFDAVSIVSNDTELYEGLGAPIVRDEKEGMGPLMGLYSGLKASESEMNFVTAVDTPLVADALVRHLVDIGESCDARVPMWEGRAEPLCAVYSRRCLGAIESVLEQGRIIAFFPLIRACFVEEPTVRKLDPRGLSFFNVNTPADYEALRLIHAAGARSPD
ncbi:MAG: molybdenum cofactor guanylyltransferase, partial [Spirochaetia bacterium]